MKTVTVVLSWGLLISMLFGCDTELRAPICAPGEMAFPEGAAGRYQLSVWTSTPEFSGAMVAAKGMFEFEIKEEADGIHVDGFSDHSKASLRSLTTSLAGGGRPSKRGLRTNDDEEPMPAPIIPLAVCKIAGVYYSQGYLDSTGSSSVTRIDLSPTGISSTGLMWNPTELEQHGFTKYFLPNFSEFDANDRDSKWTFDSLAPVRMIVENSGLSPERREELMAIAHPTLYGLVFSRITRSESAVKNRNPVVRLKIGKG